MGLVGLGRRPLAAAKRPARPPDEDTSPNWSFWIAVGAGLVGASWLSLVHAGGSSDVLMPAYAAVAIFAGLGYDALIRSDPEVPGTARGHPRGCDRRPGGPTRPRQPPRDPIRGQRGRGHRFIALVSSLPGQVIVADHPWYDTMAGKPSWAQSEAVHDVLRSGPGPARRDLLASIEATLASPSVTTVFGDDQGDTIGPGFARYFQLGPPVFTCTRCFFPVTDVPRRPYLRYDRR